MVKVNDNGQIRCFRNKDFLIFILGCLKLGYKVKLEYGRYTKSEIEILEVE